MTTTTPARATAVHACVDCAALPEASAGVVVVGSYVAAGYRPRKPRPAEGGPRSRRCLEHRRMRKAAERARARANHKATTFGLSPELQAALWTYQGGACPTGAKRSAELPPGVATDHDHDYARAHCGHDPDKGCPACVTGFLSVWANTDVVGRLTGMVGRDNVSTALRALADFLDDPPLARLLAERPELLGTDPPKDAAA